MQPKISVIIPVYNRFEYLNEALKSVFDQDPAPYEVILIDDCSSSSLEDHLRMFPPPGEVVVLRTDRNRRVAGARNWGWRHAQGDLIAFLDSDDIWEPGKLRRQLQCLAADPAAAGIYGSILAFWPNGRTEVWADDHPPVVDLLSALTDHNITVQSLLIRREALETLNGFDERFSILDDQDLAIRIAQARLRVLFFADPPMVRHRRHSANHSSRSFVYFQEECHILRQYRQLCESVYGPGSGRVWLGRALRRLAGRSRVSRIPTTILSRLLYAVAPSSAMPRELWLRRVPAPQPLDRMAENMSAIES